MHLFSDCTCGDYTTGVRWFSNYKFTIACTFNYWETNIIPERNISKDSLKVRCHLNSTIRVDLDLTVTAPNISIYEFILLWSGRKKWSQKQVRELSKDNLSSNARYHLHGLGSGDEIGSHEVFPKLVPRASALIARQKPWKNQLRTWVDWPMRIQWKYRKLFINRVIFWQHGCYHKECIQRLRKLNAGFA
jgi:hypothetical protein